MEYLTPKELHRELEHRGVKIARSTLYWHLARLPSDMVKVERKIRKNHYLVRKEAVEFILSGDTLPNNSDCQP